MCRCIMVCNESRCRQRGFSVYGGCQPSLERRVPDRHKVHIDWPACTMRHKSRSALSAQPPMHGHCAAQCYSGPFSCDRQIIANQRSQRSLSLIATEAGHASS